MLTHLQLEKATITSLPSNGGSLYQLSHIYNDHAYEPKAGQLINQTNTDVTGKGFRLLYNSGTLGGNMPYGKVRIGNRKEATKQANKSYPFHSALIDLTHNLFSWIHRLST